MELVNKMELLKQLADKLNNSQWYSETEDGFEAAMSILEDAPTVDAEPVRHGKWVGKEDQKWHCSECEGIAPKGIRYNYCPNCGAKMEEENDLYGRDNTY